MKRLFSEMNIKKHDSALVIVFSETLMTVPYHIAVGDVSKSTELILLCNFLQNTKKLVKPYIYFYLKNV